MEFFDNRRYRKEVQGLFRHMLGIGKGPVGDRLWRANPWMSETAPDFRRRGVPAIEAAAELMRRLVVQQILRTREDKRHAIFEYLRSHGENSNSPSPLAQIAFNYVHELYSLELGRDVCRRHLLGHPRHRPRTGGAESD
jgi:hypothetical protein